MGTFGGALEARQIPAGEGLLHGEATGEVEKEDGVLIIRRIHVRLVLKAPPEAMDTVERVHGFFADKCPVYRSLKDAIAITTSLVHKAG
ncbi:MAG: OsmC family protein [Bryobacteraceae bacterium]